MSRDAVLGNIRRALNRDSALTGAALETAERRLQNPVVPHRPAVDGDLQQRFLERLNSVLSTHEKIPTFEHVPDAVARYLQSEQLPTALRIAPALNHLDWSAHNDVSSGRALPEHVTSVTPCVAGIAETGSLVMAGTADSPATLAFLPENHIVVMRASQLVRHIEDVWPVLRGVNGKMPRAFNVNTGPSRTADIEQALEIGAHGPRRMHVLIVADE